MPDSFIRVVNAQAKQSFLAAIDQLIPMIEESRPGQELRDAWPLAEILIDTALALGYPHPPIDSLWYCNLDTRDQIELVEFNSPWDGGSSGERAIRIYKLDGDDLVPTKKVRPLNSEERDDLLSLLRQWRRAVNTLLEDSSDKDKTGEARGRRKGFKSPVTKAAEKAVADCEADPAKLGGVCDRYKREGILPRDTKPETFKRAVRKARAESK